MNKKISKYITLATIAILSSGIALNITNTMASADEVIIGDVSVPPTFKLFSSENGDKTYVVRNEVGIDNLAVETGLNYRLTFKNDGIFEINDTTYEVKDGLIDGNTELNIIFNLNDKVVIKQADTNLEITFLAIKDITETTNTSDIEESSAENSSSTEETTESSTTDSTNESTENSSTETTETTDSSTTESSEQEAGNKAVLVGNTITLADSYFNYYSVFYDAEKDELSFKASDLTILGIEPPINIGNINLNGKKTFQVNGENWELVDNRNGTYNLQYLDERVIRFNGLEEYSNLINTYSLFTKNEDGKVVRLIDSNLNFDVDFIDLSTEEGQGYNNNQAPTIDFKYDATSFDFDLILDESNKLAGQNFKYTYALTEEFLNSDVYKKLEGTKQYSGYIKRNVLNSGGYQAYVMEYVLIDGKLEIKVLNTALSEPSKTAKPSENFQGEGKVELETIIEEEKETTEISIPKPLKRPSNEKIEEAITIKPIQQKGEILPRMGSKFATIPLITGIGSLTVALSILLRRKFPLSAEINDDKDTEE